MKNKLLWVLVALLALPVAAFGSDSICTVSQPQKFGALYVLRIDWTGASIGGAFDQCVIPHAINGILTDIETDPGTPAPTAGYTVTLTNDRGLAITTGARSASATEIVKPTASGIAQAIPVMGGLKLDIGSNTEGGAKGIIQLYWFGQ